MKSTWWWILVLCITINKTTFAENNNNTELYQQEELDDISSLEWLSDIHNPKSWKTILPGQVSLSCWNDLRHYLENLENGTSWAVQMADAGGRYGSQFFFGNGFWLGSHTLCKELKPPFRLSFRVARLKLKLSPLLTPEPRTVLLGLCLPANCGTQDVRSLLYQSSAVSSDNNNSTRSIEIQRIRQVPGQYSLFRDHKFYILGGVTTAIVLLAMAGTMTEVMLWESQKVAEKKKQGLFIQLLLCFSALSNGQKIIQCSNAEDSINCIHGLRFLSLAWVIMVHTYLQVFAIAENKGLRSVTERNFLFQTVSNATFSVDTFFFISGLLVTFIYLRSASKSEDTSDPKKSSHTLKSGCMKFAILILYRFIRLTPVYLFVLGMVEILVRWIHSNSVFEVNFADHVNCDRYWWRNALYINSLYPKKEICMLWTWYMANDTQFYVLGIFLLILASRYFKLVAALWGVFLVSSWGTTAFISLHHHYRARIQEPFAFFDELYDKPWTRIGPYLIGMATGWLLFRIKCRIRMPMFVAVFCWALSFMCMLSLVYGLVRSPLDEISSAAWVSVGHTAWGIALGWIVVACCTGYGGVINRLLSFSALYPLSRLTYCAYLVHPFIMLIVNFQMDGPLHLHNALVIVLYFGNVVAAFMLSFVLSLLFEAPVVRILKIATGH